MHAWDPTTIWLLYVQVLNKKALASYIGLIVAQKDQVML
jgi:hypothetical protein